MKNKKDIASIKFKDLINMLRKVEDTSDMTPELINELVGATLAAVALYPGLDPEMPELERIKYARMYVLDYFDEVILDAAAHRGRKTN